MTRAATLTAIATAVLTAGCIAVGVLLWETEAEYTEAFSSWVRAGGLTEETLDRPVRSDNTFPLLLFVAAGLVAVVGVILTLYANRRESARSGNAAE